MASDTKRQLYAGARAEIEALIDGCDDPIAAMASCCAVLHGRIEAASWTGFYRVVAPRLLRIGPYQGPVGCLEIPFEQGVCGAAARRRETLIVDDVHAFEGHIACDPRAAAEIVVPVLDPRGELAAVLDVDSHATAAFDAEDARGLEAVVRLLAPSFG